MPIFNRVKTPEKIFIIQIENVPREVKLSAIVNSFIGAKSIIGVFRVMDYKTKISDTSAFAYFHDEQEYVQWCNAKQVTINSENLRLCFLNWFCSGVDRNIKWEDSLITNFHDGPINLQLKHVRTAYRITTPHLLEILHPFEAQFPNQCTGIQLLYNRNKKCLRDFGFVSFNSRKPLEYYERKRKISVLDYEIKMTPTTKSCVIVSEYNRNYLANPILTENADLQTANWLISDSTIGDFHAVPPARKRSISPADSVYNQTVPKDVQGHISKKSRKDEPSTSKTIEDDQNILKINLDPDEMLI